MLRRSICVVLSVLGLLSGVAGAVEPATSIDELSITRNGDTVTYQGRASVVDASTAVLATDPAGDASQGDIGADIVEASISPSADRKDLAFSLRIADPIDEIFTIPEVVHYHWLIGVTQETTVYYLLQAMRSGQYDRVLPNPDPLFRVNACGKTATGQPSCFEALAYVQGQMANGVVRWEIPREVIGATKGATVSFAQYGYLESDPGASGASYLRGGLEFDKVEAMIPYVVGPAAEMFLVSEGPTPTVVTRALGSVGGDGTFVGKLQLPTLHATKTYSLVTRVCHGAADRCGESKVGVPGA